MNKTIDFNSLYEAYKRGDPPGDNIPLYCLSQVPDLSREEFISLAIETTAELKQGAIILLVFCSGVAIGLSLIVWFLLGALPQC